MALSGIDISHWNGTIDWQAVANDDVKFVYIKATDGVAYNKTDYFLHQVPLARDVGLYVGGYHFAQPRPDRDPKDEAKFFVSTLEQAGYGSGTRWLPGVFDIEVNNYGMSWKQLSDYTNSFAEEYRRLTGDTCIAYMSRSWSDQIPYRPLWVAWWTTTMPVLPSGTLFWQYTNKGRVAGMIGDVDLNFFMGSMEDLDRLSGGGGIDMFVKRGDTGPACVYWQKVLSALGFFSGEYFESYGPLTDTAVNAFRKSVGLPALTTTAIDADMAFRLHQALAKKYAGAPGEKGDKGDQGDSATLEQIQTVVNAWMAANFESLRGPAGRAPTVEEVTNAVTPVVIDWLNANRENIKGEPGEPGKTPTGFNLKVEPVWGE